MFRQRTPLLSAAGRWPARMMTWRGSVLVLYRAGVPVDLQPLYKRVVDGDDVGNDRLIVAFEVPDLQPLVIEAFELQGKVAAHIFDRQVQYWRNVRSEQPAHAGPRAA